MSINAMQLPAINTQVQNDETFLLASKKPSNDTKKTSVGLDVLITTTQGIASIFFACAVYKAIFSKTTDGVFGPNSVFFAYYMVALVLDHSANKLNRTTAATLKSLYFDHQLSRNFHRLNSSNYPFDNQRKYLQEQKEKLENGEVINMMEHAQHQIRNLDPKKCEELSKVAMRAIHDLKKPNHPPIEITLLYDNLYAETFGKCKEKNLLP